MTARFSHCGSHLLLARDAARKSQNTSSVLVASEMESRVYLWIGSKMQQIKKKRLIRINLSIFFDYIKKTNYICRRLIELQDHFLYNKFLCFIQIVIHPENTSMT